MFNPVTLRNPFASPMDDHAGTVEPYAQRLFDRAMWAYQTRKLRAALAGHKRHLRLLKDVLAGATITHRYEIGARTVPLDQIRGSVDKGDDFDIDFYPAQERTENRWVQVATAFVRGLTLPPVELIQVGDTYFVLDGHHRISVARTLKYTHIDALVTVWEVQ